MQFESKEDCAAAIRGLLGHQGWTKVVAPGIQAKQNQAKDQLALIVGGDAEVHSDYKGWPAAKVAGFILGLGWARQAWPTMLSQLDGQIAAAKAEDAPPAEPEGHGHPYAPEGD